MTTYPENKVRSGRRRRGSEAQTTTTEWHGSDWDDGEVEELGWRESMMVRPRR
jgi:hypothetical protein